MNLDDFLSSTVDSLAKTTNKFDKKLHSSNSNIKDSFIDDFIHSLYNFLDHSRDVIRLKQMPENTMYEIDGEDANCFVTVVNDRTPNLPKLNGFPNNVFYIPKNMCSPNINESLYKTENLIQEEVSYKNYLQLKDGVYKIVDKDGNILQ